MDPAGAIKLKSGPLNPMGAVMIGKIKLSGDLRALAILQDLQEFQVWALGTARKGSATPLRTAHPPGETHDGGHRPRRSRTACEQLHRITFRTPAGFARWMIRREHMRKIGRSQFLHCDPLTFTNSTRRSTLCGTSTGEDFPVTDSCTGAASAGVARIS